MSDERSDADRLLSTIAEQPLDDRSIAERPADGAAPGERPPKPPEAGDDWVFCRRAHVWGPPAQNVPWGGALGDEIRAKVCEASWQEWLQMEVMVINELRLNFMDPKSQDVLISHMREFLALDSEV